MGGVNAYLFKFSGGAASGISRSTLWKLWFLASHYGRRQEMENGTVLTSNVCTDLLAKPVRATGLNLSCRRARLAFVSLRPMVLNFGV